MSQSHHPTDTQALLQSMLQRLKLQPGREGQAYLKTPVSITAASPQGQGAPSLQQVNSPVNVFGVNGELGRSLTSLPSQNVNTDHDTGESRVLEQATWLGVTPTTSGQLFPAQSRKDADLTSFERTDDDRVTFGGFAKKRHIPPDTGSVSSMRPNPVQGLTPKIYFWSMKSTDADTAGQGNKTLHMGNEVDGSREQSKDVQIVSKTTNSRRKQWSSENKTRRWTLKIKEKWKDRQGNLGKKGKEEGGTADQMTEQGTPTSTPNQLLMSENVMTTPEEDGAPDNSGSSKILPAQWEDNFFDNNFRSTNDSEIGFGSFSLLEEIIKGQEWAKFINPNFSANSVSQTPVKEPLNQHKIQPNPQNYTQSPGILNQLGGGSNQWTFKSTESTPGTFIGMPQTSPQAFTSASMDMSEGKQQQQCVYRQSDPSESMKDSCKQSDVRSAETGPGLQLRPSSFPVLADNPHSSARKSRLQTSRKRQHQSAERRDEKLQTEKMSDGKEADRGSISCPSSTSCNMMDESGETQQDNVIPLYALNLHPTPLPSSLSNPFAPAPRGVLRHSMAQQTESSMETLTKRRRVEENRRVHFSEDVVTISSPDLDLDAVDSEEDSGSGAEEDSVTDSVECEMEQAVTEEVAPVRRTALPAWILALKRKNTGRKHS
ncbi:uncharacterized protein LOC121643635 [Melanotaenia boesemani]|uniref:uncharacterized protein LOC121643635 n=1 Tax=Melanotaenia boesemani TaxID=1250792 RepID=UPI001C03B59F|nr:uncharacterized protein LOC121643635 [Melanotaenia boesemani]